jgi:hypothetical protein
LDLVTVMQNLSMKRTAAVEFKQDSKDYMARKDELEYEQMLEEKEALKAQQRARSWKKKAVKPTGGAGKAAGSSNGNNKEHFIGSPEYEKSMQKLRQRLLKAGKRDNWLQKMTGNDPSKQKK